jgi:hypothetical protein
VFSDYLLVIVGAVIGGTVVLGCQLAYLAHREGLRQSRFRDVDALARGGRS